jgi:(1->4)-alpha-D-glucan 1-alpha-D-glucosylmutase
VLRPFAERVAAYLLKAAREAKLRTSWASPDEAYETALERFVRRALDPALSARFLEALRDFVRALAPPALANGLAQTVLRATAPGVPDTFQGTELWDLSLVDPDNRRPVDFAARDAALQGFDDVLTTGTTREQLATELLAGWSDGRIKLYVLATLLRRRAERGWPANAYQPLEADGARADHAVAYARGETVVVVPRLPRTLAGSNLPLGAVWQATFVVLPQRSAARYRDLLTGRDLPVAVREGRRVLPLADALAVLPVAVLEPV